MHSRCRRSRIPVVEYNPIAAAGLEGSTTGRGGMRLRDYDHTRSQLTASAGQRRRTFARGDVERLHWFLEGVIPVAEQSGVRLAMHPNDPPIPVFRGRRSQY
ncbi:MAG: mannonate dehydratase [Bryobacterales bacterium]